MFVIGLLVAAAAAVFVAVVTIEDWGGPAYSIHGFGHVLGHLTLAEVFVAGLGISAIFFIALWFAGFMNSVHRRRSAQRRAEARALRENYDAVRADRDRLAREVAAQCDTDEAAQHSSYPSDAEEVDPAAVHGYQGNGLHDTQEIGRHSLR
jgi:hypothetical protein